MSLASSRGVVDILERQNDQDRAEDLFLNDRTGLVHADQHGRLDKEARPTNSVPTRRDARSACNSLFDIAADCVHLAQRNQRSHLRIWREPRPDLQFRGARRHAFNHLVEYRALNVEPRSRSAGLALVREDRGDRPRYRRLEVRVVKDNDGRLAAELQRKTRHALDRVMTDVPADFGRAGKRDLVDAGMTR